MKRMRFLGCLLAILLLVGCGNSGETTATEATATEGTATEGTATETTATEATATEAAAAEAADAGTSLSEEDPYGFGDRKQITVGITGSYEPFTYEENGELKGYSVDMWQEFTNRTGIEVKYERTDFSGLLGALESGRSDVVDAQMSPTPEREEKFKFTEPVDYYGGTVVVKGDNEDIKTVEDLKGKKIGVGSGNEMQNTVNALYEEGDITWEVYTTATLENMLKDVDFGRIDGMLAQNIQAGLAIEKGGYNAKMTPLFETNVATLVVKKENEDLLNSLNAFIQDIKADGTLKEISMKWVGMDISKPE